MQQNYFLYMIKNLRLNEEVMLYNNILQIKELESEEVVSFLKQEYENEILNYPFTAPQFNSESALWAAKTIYYSTQLMLYREHKEADLNNLIPDFEKEIATAEILSADLVLRFLPNIINQLKFIDSEDKLIALLEEKLIKWHYSGVNYKLEINKLNFDAIKQNKTMLQLYINKIMEFKNIELAKHSIFKSTIDDNLGLYASTFWNTYKLET